MMSVDKNREAFEAWFLSERKWLPANASERMFLQKEGNYENWAVNDAWEAWQAALQSQDREDAERLDFLEARAHDSSYATQIRLLRDPDINSGMNRIEVRTGVGSGMWERPTEGHSLREAIDAAMEKQK